MKALRALEVGANRLGLVEVPKPSHLRPGEVLLRTLAVGVCGSDVHAWHGTQTYPMRYPVTLGHEASGVVAEVGPGVEGLAIGERVVSETARTVCGRCECCREGRYNLCQARQGFGALSDGAMGEFFVTRYDIVHAVPDSVPDEVAALTEPYCVAYNATVERARVRPGDSVTVIGPGPVGLFAAEIAGLCGASDILVVGLPGDDERLAVAEALGGSTTTDPGWWSREDLANRSEVVIDSSGVSATLEAALAVVKPGGQVVKVGWGPEPYLRPLDALVAKAVELHGSFSHTWSTWERVLRLMGGGQLRPGRALRTYDFDEWEKAFSAMAQRQVSKAVLVLS